MMVWSGMILFQSGMESFKTSTEGFVSGRNSFQTAMYLVHAIKSIKKCMLKSDLNEF